MSAGGKRLAKRSIVGTRISAPMRETGQYFPGVIIGSKNPDELYFNNCHTGITPNSKYVVRFETTGETREFPESELVGPGFGSVSSLKLRSGQKTFVTHNGREVSGNVVYHRPQIDEVLINIPPTPGSNEIPFDVTKKLDEVRLLESRKSARLQLQEQDFDFARLADVADRKRSQQTASIDVPRNNNMSRKRRPSSGSLFQPVMIQGGGDGEMDECAAALVLMSLSGSPKSPHWGENNVGMISSSWSSSSSGASSWLSTNQSVVGSLGAVSSPGELHFNNNSPTPSSSDEGVESDLGEWDAEPRRKRTKQIYKCTFPGCTTIKDRCFDIETHVRFAHLGGKQTSPDDHEEEFYYTEIEVATDLPASPAPFGSSNGLGIAFSPTLSHMDMARPPSEDPEYKLFQQQQLQHHHQRKSPSGNTHLNPKKRASPKASPARRPRGDTKKCRKVYGMDRRELWCTQCKWKKACTRFSD